MTLDSVLESFAYTRLAEEDDLAAISRVGENDYELRLYRNGSHEHLFLTPYAIHFIGHQEKKYGYLSNVEFERLIGTRVEGKKGTFIKL